MARKRFEARIAGRVQGVGFRFFARQTANEFGISGHVRNLPDGSLEVVAEGEEDILTRYLEALSDGPRAARVDDVRVEWTSPLEENDRFLVKP